MKAKHISKLRRVCRLYEVKHSYGLFGSFDDFYGSMVFPITVLATSYRNACYRAKRRGYGLEYEIDSSERTAKWGRWKVKLFGASDHFKNIKYF